MKFINIKKNYHLRIKVIKPILKIIFTFFIMASGYQAHACDFIFTIQGETKAQYAAGDEIVVVVTMKLSHRVCHETLEDTKFNFSGLKVLGATKWTETSPKEFQRKFKLRVAPDKSGVYMMSAERSCDKDGGRGSVKFNVR